MVSFIGFWYLYPADDEIKDQVAKANWIQDHQN